MPQQHHDPFDGPSQAAGGIHATKAPSLLDWRKAFIFVIIVAALAYLGYVAWSEYTRGVPYLVAFEYAFQPPEEGAERITGQGAITVYLKRNLSAESINNLPQNLSVLIKQAFINNANDNDKAALENSLNVFPLFINDLSTLQ